VVFCWCPEIVGEWWIGTTVRWHMVIGKLMPEFNSAKLVVFCWCPVGLLIADGIIMVSRSILFLMYWKLHYLFSFLWWNLYGRSGSSMSWPSTRWCGHWPAQGTPMALISLDFFLSTLTSWTLMSYPACLHNVFFGWVNSFTEFVVRVLDRSS